MIISKKLLVAGLMVAGIAQAGEYTTEEIVAVILKYRTKGMDKYSAKECIQMAVMHLDTKAQIEEVKIAAACECQNDVFPEVCKQKMLDAKLKEITDKREFLKTECNLKRKSGMSKEEAGKINYKIYKQAVDPLV